MNKNNAKKRQSQKVNSCARNKVDVGLGLGGQRLLFFSKEINLSKNKNLL
jgi:hypothetical protein